MVGISRRQAVWTAAGLVLAGVALRLGGLGLHGLWLDEATSLQFARHDLQGCLWAEVNNPPLHRLLLHGWVRLVGPGSDALLRLPAALFGVAATVVLWGLARRVLSRGAALLALALFVLDPYHLLLSQELRAYSLLTLLSLFSWWLHLEELDPRRRGAARMGWSAALGVALAAGLYTHYQFLWVILGIGIHRGWRLLGWRLLGWRLLGWRLLGPRPPASGGTAARPDDAAPPRARSRPRGIGEALATLAPLIGAAVVFAPWFWVFLREVGPQYRGYTTNLAGRVLSLPFMLLLGESAVVRRYPESYAHAAGRHLWLLIPFVLSFVPLLGSGVRALWRADARPKGRPAARATQSPTPAEALPPGRFVLWAAALPLAGLALLFPWLPLFTARYLSFVAPLLCLICAAGAVRLRWRRVGALAVGLLLALQVLSLGRYHLDPRFGRENWREAAAWVMARQRGGDVILFDHHYVQIPFDRYHHGPPSVREVGMPAGSAERVSLLRRLCADPPTRLFLVLSHSWDTGRQSLDTLQRCLCREQWRIFRQSSGIEVHRLGQCHKTGLRP